MSKYTLSARLPLAGYVAEFEGIKLIEVTGLSLVSMAVPKYGEKTLANSVKKNLKAKLPKIGQTSHTKTGNTCIYGLQSDQYFVQLEYDGNEAAKHLAGIIGDHAYYSDQSDSWVMLRLSGEGCQTALERICSLNLAADKFPVGSVARTSMEHLAVIIVAEEKNQYLLLSPRSSANSFLHAIETSIHNVI